MKKLTVLLFIVLATAVAHAQTTPDTIPAPTQQPVAPVPVTPTPVAPTPAPAPTTPVKVEIVEPTPAKPSAEPQTYEKFNIGLQVTPMLKWINTDNKNVESDGTDLGFSYGLIGEIFFAPKYAFYTGLEFANRGGKVVVSDSVKRNIHLNYLEIPLCLQMHTKEKKNLSFFARFGTSACFNVKAFYKDDNDDKVSINSDVAFYTMAFKIGGGAQYSIDGGTKIFAGLIFNNGFMNAFESSANKSTNMSVDLNIGIYF